MSEIVQGLWIGPRLSIMERLSIVSFLANGHEYHLCLYEEARDVPSGVIIKDANEILPASAIFKYKDHPSYAGFANSFRYKLLLEKGGWWADTDIVCLKPLDFEEDYVFAREAIGPREAETNAIFKTPPGAEIMHWTWQTCMQKNPEKLFWGETGPHLLTEAVDRFDLRTYSWPHNVFCPIPYRDWKKALDPSLSLEFGDSTYCVHLWNEMWRRAEQDKDAGYDPKCLYEQLKRRYLV